MKRKLNILFTSDSRGVSGAEIVMLDIIKNLDKARFVPFVFCHEKNKQMVERIKALNIEYNTTTEFPNQAKVGDPTLAPSKIIRYIRGMIILYYQIEKIIKTKKIDLIYANSYPNCLFCSLPALINRRIMVWHVHDISRIHRLNWFVYIALGMMCSKIITVSNACRENLLEAKINPSKIVTVYNWVDLKKFNPDIHIQKTRSKFGIGETDKIVGFVGQPIPDKGHKYFIEAAAEVIKILPNTKFLIVGYLFKSNYQRSLYDLINKLNIQNEVIFTGWRDDVPEVMASIDVLAHARINPEPFALVLLEAMAMRKPVVASRTGGVPEAILDGITGFLVPPQDSKALSEAIIKLLENPQKAKQMGLNGRKRIENYFTLEKQIKMIENLLEEIVQ